MPLARLLGLRDGTRVLSDVRGKPFSLSRLSTRSALGSSFMAVTDVICEEFLALPDSEFCHVLFLIVSFFPSVDVMHHTY